LPYSAPTYFFDGLPEKTLLVAKMRLEHRRKNKRLVRFVTLFASAAAVLVLVMVAPSTKRLDNRRSENVEAVLKDLSNDELTNMTVVYGSDMMEEEWSQEKTY
jgi:hypothetical protein